MTIEVIEFIQNFRNDFFDLFFNFISFLGEEYVYIILLTIIYYTYDKKLGEMLGYVLIVSTGLNEVFKNIFKTQRPFQKYEDRVVNLREHTSSGYSFPSGHTQVFTSVLFGIAYYIKKRWLYITVMILSVFMAISRMYLGVHFLEDVLVSIILGITLSYLYYRFYTKHNENQQMLLRVNIITFLIMILLLIFVQSKTYVTTVGMFGGYALAMWFEKTYVNFTVKVSIRNKIIRVIIALVLMIAIQTGFKMIYTSIFSNDTILLLFDFIRYFLLVFVGLGILPYYCKKLNI